MTFPDTDLRKASENPLTSVFPRVALGQKPYHRDERIAKIHIACPSTLVAVKLLQGSSWRLVCVDHSL